MPDYNEKYSNAECYWGKKPHSLVVELSKYLKPGAKILDLGAGEGRDALFLSKNGFNVTAVDNSEVGINKINQLAQELNLKIKTEVSDILDFLDKCDNYDAVIAINVLQFIKQVDINKAIEKIQAKTNHEGFNAIASFVAPDPEKKQNAIAKNRYAFDEGELKNYYSKWDFLQYMEKWSEIETHGQEPHRHYMVWLLAQKI